MFSIYENRQLPWPPTSVNQLATFIWLWLSSFLGKLKELNRRVGTTTKTKSKMMMTMMAQRPLHSCWPIGRPAKCSTLCSCGRGSPKWSNELLVRDVVSGHYVKCAACMQLLFDRLVALPPSAPLIFNKFTNATGELRDHQRVAGPLIASLRLRFRFLFLFWPSRWKQGSKLVAHRWKHPLI